MKAEAKNNFASTILFAWHVVGLNILNEKMNTVFSKYLFSERMFLEIEAVTVERNDVAQKYSCYILVSDNPQDYTKSGSINRTLSSGRKMFSNIF